MTSAETDSVSEYIEGQIAEVENLIRLSVYHSLPEVVAATNQSKDPLELAWGVHHAIRDSCLAIVVGIEKNDRDGDEEAGINTIIQRLEALKGQQE